MATLGMIPIADRQSAFDSGAALLCAQKCRTSEVVRLDSRAEVEVRNTSPYVVVRIRGAVNPIEVFDRAHEAAQEALDHLAILAKADLSIRNASDEHILWWREDSEQVLRVVVTSTLPFTVEVSATVTDKDGSIIPPAPAARLTYSESLRYFRLSQVTDDLFDAFRNMYLAFELLLERTCPRRVGKKREGEGAWLRRALTVVNEMVALSQAYKATGPDIINDIYGDLYEGIRCRIFHAKYGSRLVPQNLADRELVSDGLDKLTRVFLLLARELLNANHAGGGLTYEGFVRMTEPLMSGSTVLVSDNDTPLDSSATLESPPFIVAVPMLTRAAPELSRPGLRTILGSISAADFKRLHRIARFGLAHVGHLIMSGAVEAVLTHDGIDRIESQMGMQLRNVKYPKKLFKT